MPHTAWPRRKKPKKSDQADVEPAVLQNVQEPWPQRAAKRKRRSDAHSLADVPEAVPNARPVRIERRIKKRRVGHRIVDRPVAATPATADAADPPIDPVDTCQKIADRLIAGRTESRLCSLMDMHMFQKCEMRQGDALQPLPGVFGTMDGSLICILNRLARRGVVYLDVVPLTPHDAAGTLVAKLNDVKTVRARDVSDLNLHYEILPLSRRTTKTFRFRKREDGPLDFQRLQALRTQASWQERN